MEEQKKTKEVNKVQDKPISKQTEKPGKDIVETIPESPKIKDTRPEKNILILDDDKSLMNDAKKYGDSKRDGKYKVNIIFAENAKICLDTIKEKKIDLIIIELILPTINGFYVINALEETNIPIIIYTRLSGSDDLKKISETKIDNIFLKELTKIESLIDFLSTKENYKEDIKQVILKLQEQIKSKGVSENKEKTKIIQCPSCNIILPPKSHFCNNCGKKIFQEYKVENKKTENPTPVKNENIPPQKEKEPSNTNKK